MRVGLVLLLMVLAGCVGTVRPMPGKLAPWTTGLRDRQPDDAHFAIYRVSGEHLVFVVAKHANHHESLTFRLIRSAYGAFDIDTVIAEGFPTSRGANPDSILRYAAASRPGADGFVAEGETVPTVLGAQAEGATLLGGEPDDVLIKNRLLADGFAAEDLLGFYVLRNIPQWIGERKIEHAGDARLAPLVEEALHSARAKLQLPPSALADFAQWAAWYHRINQRPIGASFATEEVGPLADGRFGTNRLAHAVSKVRDTYLHEMLIGHLNARKTVMVVFGASHLMIQRPALDAALGKPCYVGTDTVRAVAACR